MTPQEKEQRLLDEAEKFANNSVKENHYQFDSQYAQAKFEIAQAFLKGAQWQSQQTQETPELFALKQKFVNWHIQNEERITEDVWNFFAQYIKGTDAVEFAEWIRNEGWEGRKHVGWINHNHAADAMGNRRFYTTTELYDLFKSLPKAPKEVGGE